MPFHTWFAINPLIARLPTDKDSSSYIGAESPVSKRTLAESGLAEGDMRSPGLFICQAYWIFMPMGNQPWPASVTQATDKRVQGDLREELFGETLYRW